jgi:tetratricopeptide (TPR) repeat protein
MKKFLLSFIILWPLQTFAQLPAEPLDSRLDKLRAEGSEALYNLEYNNARLRFKEMAQLAPQDPLGPLSLASALWFQQLNESWELKGTLFSTSSPPKDSIDPKRNEEIRSWVRQAKQLAKERLRRDARDVDALYMLGAAEGLEAAFAAAVERKYMAALRGASDSVEHHRAVLKLEPKYTDAELTIGLNSYVVGSLPLPVKMVAGTLGVKGSKKRGLETLEKVSREGQWTRDTARLLLVDLYKREKRWSDAVKVARELSEKYPKNYVFKLQLADALASKVRFDSKSSQSTTNPDQLEFVKIFDSMLDQKALESPTLQLVHFRYGEALFSVGDLNRASKEFQAVVNSSAAKPSLREQSRLRITEVQKLCRGATPCAGLPPKQKTK